MNSGPGDKTGADLVREMLSSPGTLEQLAKRVVEKYKWVEPSAVRRHLAAELHQDAVVVLLAKAATYDPATGHVQAWAYTVMKNRFLDQQREYNAKKRGGSVRTLPLPPNDDAMPPTDDFAVRDAVDDSIRKPFDESDLAIIEGGLSPANRIVTLAIFDLMDNVPVRRLEAWQAEADLGPFPRDQFDLADKSQQLQILCDWKGTSRNDISQVRLRAQKLLKKLEFVKSIQRDI